MKNQVEIVDTIGTDSVYSSSGNSSSGFLANTSTPINNGTNSINVDLGNLNSKVSGDLRFLRVKAVNRDIGTVISIQPVQDNDLPNQIRRIEAFSYILNSAETAAPVVFSQLPLSPPTPSPLEHGLSVSALTQPICGNGIVEGGESCDDGNTLDNNECSSDCNIGCGCPFVAPKSEGTCRIHK